MKIFLLVTSFLLFKVGYSQQPHKTTYITVVIEATKVNFGKIKYFKIIEQSGNQFAWEIISLVPYDERGKTVFKEMIYNGYLDSTKKYYNYFEKPADAFQFLADNSWELVTVYRDENSEGQQIYVRPIFYFKKQLQ
jgi:hypothetical protein